MERRIVCKRIFGYAHVEDAQCSFPCINIFAEMEDGDVPCIAKLPVDGSLAKEPPDSPKIRAVALEVAHGLGYSEEGEDKGAFGDHFSRCADAWSMFRAAHPLMLSLEVHIANAVRFSDIGPSNWWRDDPEAFEGICSLVQSLGETTERSPNRIVDAISDLISEGVLSLSGYKRDPSSFAAVVAKRSLS